MEAFKQMQIPWETRKPGSRTRTASKPCYRREKNSLNRRSVEEALQQCWRHFLRNVPGERSERRHSMDLCTTPRVDFSSSKCERVVAHHALLKLRQLVRVDMPCRKQDGSRSAHFVRTAGCFFKDLNWRSLKCSGMPLAKWSKSSDVASTKIVAPRRTQLSHMIMYGMLAGNHKVAHLLYSTNFYHPTLRHSCGHLFFMTSPIHIKKLIRTGTYPTVNQHSYFSITILNYGRSINDAIYTIPSGNLT